MKERTMKKLEYAIRVFDYNACMLTFNPNTGEDIPYECLSKDDKDLYNALTIGAEYIQNRLIKVQGKSLQMNHNIIEDICKAVKKSRKAFKRLNA